MSSTSDNLPLAPILTDSEIAALSQLLYKSALQHDISLHNIDGTSSLDENNGSTSAHQGFANRYDTSSYERPPNILNAFAFVSAKYESSAQYMALSAAMGQKVYVYIAWNWEKPNEEVKIHLKSLWTHMQCIAYVRHYIRCGNASERRGWASIEIEEAPSGVKEILSGRFSGRDPDLIVLEELHKKFMHGVQTFCYPKTRRRVKKYLAPGISEFYKFYFDINRDFVNHGDVLAKVIHSLYYISRIVMVNINEDNPDNFSGLDWSQLLHMFRVLHHRYIANVDEILGRARLILHTCRELQEVKEDTTLHNFNIVKAIYKISELGTYIYELLDFAYSPRRHAVLQKDIEIIFVDSIVDRAPEPLSHHEMTAIAKLVFDTTWYNPATNFYERMLAAHERQTKSVEAALSARASSLSVHPEMALLIYHHQQFAKHRSNPEFIAPFEYIAVNGSPCICSRAMLDAYSKATERSFILYGHNPKLSAPWWAATDCFEPKLAAAMKRIFYWNMVEVYTAQLREFEELGGVKKQDGFDEVPLDNSVAQPEDGLEKKRKKK
ncbi:uncharacterized protein H6S33_006306 [Morchella sextelata]|uniref:uncharacterized protein n=1 Tax=Morchella sextelata TaxID=1174677 RepID=UPI001D0369F6|nr:uncharacterized protein H6S33_006306 [Morchella sextelata]KAH0604638.1 hypothetical protein H6S33_006306 [Morchella sextelata]